MLILYVKSCTLTNTQVKVYFAKLYLVKMYFAMTLYFACNMMVFSRDLTFLWNCFLLYFCIPFDKDVNIYEVDIIFEKKTNYFFLFNIEPLFGKEHQVSAFWNCSIRMKRTQKMKTKFLHTGDLLPFWSVQILAPIPIFFF